MFAVQPSVQLHDKYKVKLSPKGRVTFQPTMSQKLFCEPNYKDWPYGLQNCTFQVGSYHYSKQDILVSKTDKLLETRPVLMSQIHIVETKMEDFLDGEESYVKVSIIFKGVMHQNASSSESSSISTSGKNIHKEGSTFLFLTLLPLLLCLFR